MSDSSQSLLLRQFLVGQYDELKSQLTRRLGSEDMAGEVLQETYLHLERPARIAFVHNPKQYLLTIATNIARMNFRRDRRWTSLSDLDEALGFADDAPDQLRIVAGREEMAALKRAFGELAPRRQYILFASRVEGIRLRDIAKQLGVSQRFVEKELRAALTLCGASLRRDVIQRFGPRPRQASTEIEEVQIIGQDDDHGKDDPLKRS